MHRRSPYDLRGARVPIRAETATEGIVGWEKHILETTMPLTESSDLGKLFCLIWGVESRKAELVSRDFYFEI